MINDPEILAEEIEKKEKGFAIHIIKNHQMINDLLRSDSMLKDLEQNYCWYMYQKAFKEYLIELEKLKNIDIKTNKKEYLNQNRIMSRKEERQRYWNDKWMKVIFQT